MLSVHTFLEYWGLINNNIAPDLSIPLSAQLLSPTANRQKQPVEQLLDLQKNVKKVESPGVDLVTHQNIFPVPSLPQHR